MLDVMSIARDNQVIYSDEDLVAVDKSAGYLAIPDRYDPDAPVVANELRKDWGRLFIVHRIDKDTSGLIHFARDAEAHKFLSESFATGEVKKVYRALVRGLPDWDETRCELPLKADGDRLHRTIVDAHRGTVSVSSEPGRGARFTVRFPVPPGSA